MVVVERARQRVGSEVPVRVTSVLTTANGRLVFGRPVDDEGVPAATPLRQRRPVGAAGPSPAAMPPRRSS
jgi:hypothetical protein